MRIRERMCSYWEETGGEESGGLMEEERASQKNAANSLLDEKAIGRHILI